MLCFMQLFTRKFDKPVRVSGRMELYLYSDRILKMLMKELQG